jgi:DNA-binding transcriptional MerR regulator
MAEPTTTGARASHLAIGEVLGLLVEEFPEVTISKIRFLESQGLIDPERTPSGYRKFYDDDIELLRCVLREQRENFLPLKVIKERLDSGEIDPTDEQQRPRGIKNVADDLLEDPPSPTIEQSRLEHPSGSMTSIPAAAVETVATTLPFDGEAPSTIPTEALAGPLADRLTAVELCDATGLTKQQLDELESYGVLGSDAGAGGSTFGPDALEIARCAKQLLDAGVDARHLRGWRVAAERESGLFEQLIQPLLRQRNPDANRQVLDDLAQLEAVGGRLRTALVHAALRHHSTS